MSASYPVDGIHHRRGTRGPGDGEPAHLPRQGDGGRPLREGFGVLSGDQANGTGPSAFLIAADEIPGDG